MLHYRNHYVTVWPGFCTLLQNPYNIRLGVAEIKKGWWGQR